MKIYLVIEVVLAYKIEVDPDSGASGTRSKAPNGYCYLLDHEYKAESTCTFYFPSSVLLFVCLCPPPCLLWV